MKLLSVDSAILGAQSISRLLSAATVQQLKEDVPAMEVISADGLAISKAPKDISKQAALNAIAALDTY